MPRNTFLPLLLVCASFSGACLTTGGPAAVELPSAPVVADTAATDPAVELIAVSNMHFERGRQELADGHLAEAKAQFNSALESILTSSTGADGDARVRAHFDHLVDQISALELTALAAGDGFTEQHSEPAAIDALLSLDTFDTRPPTAETALAVQADLRTIDYDIPVPANDKVLRYVEAFQGRLREFLDEGLTRGAEYLPMIQGIFREEGVPLDLGFVPLIESAFKPTALSRASARGVWQFMRGTALENGLKHDWYVDERADPYKATRAAAKYLKSLYGMFGDWQLALAAYNGGPGRMQRALRRSGKDDFWSLASSTRYLPRETREYVPMILAAVIIARNPAQYGFQVMPASPRVTEAVLVPPAVDLRRVAEWAGVTVDDIQAMNPELRRWTTPLRGEGYEVRVPVGTAQAVRAGLAEASPTQLNALQWHTVTRGESLATIARKLRVKRTDLAEANYLSTRARVSTGQKLVIPRMPSAALLARAAAGDTAAPDAVAAVFETPPEPDPVIYRVRRGDSLYAIARKYGTTVAELKAWNKLRTNRLQIGDRLVIPTQQ
ncbi:MAG: LysM peptidoglycan-binding domain-containing protein [Vicinamibacterales bacterium]